MKIIAYTALRYGRDYYDAAIRSIIDAVDEYHVLYAVNPSHGHWSDVPCPETEDELRAIAEHRAGAKLRWHRGHWAYEGQQRESIHQYVPDADVILVLDADEVWDTRIPDIALQAFDWCVQHERSKIRWPMIHYWRSMQKAVLHDPALPERIIFPKVLGNNYTVPGTSVVINHFGYAQRPEIVQYKWLIHGHKNELRRDVDWFNDVFMANRQYDCHPVGSDHWRPETVNPLDYLPAWMADHPYYGMDVIE